jgi:hypothetical protein
LLGAEELRRRRALAGGGAESLQGGVGHLVACVQPVNSHQRLLK